MSVATVYNFEEHKIKQYNPCYSYLLNLILDMNEEQQSLLLEQAHQITTTEKKSTSLNVIFDKNQVVISGLIIGCLITSLFFIIF